MHPSTYQLKKVFEKYFSTLRLDSVCQQVTLMCDICNSIKKFPKVLDKFEPKVNPSHPGEFFNTDVVKRAGQKIVVTTDLFSSYTTACFVNSESTEDLVQGLLNTTSPVRHANIIQVRVDRATAFKALANKPNKDLEMNGIKIFLGDSFNKNANATVDKRIQELQSEIRKISPTESKLTIGQLSRTIGLLNGRIRNHGLSAAEIHFSRKDVTGENLNLLDNKIKEASAEFKQENNKRSTVSKTPHGKCPAPMNASPGDIVYVRQDLSKNKARSPFLVTSVIDNDKVNVRKLGNVFSTNSIKNNRISSNKLIVQNKHVFKPPTSKPIMPTYPVFENIKPPVKKRSKLENTSWIPSLQELDTDFYD